LLEKTKKINKPFINMTKWRRDEGQINKIIDKKGDITTTPKKFQESLESNLRSYTHV
jgi:hypothetical protein